jgi:hypothetical protein
MMGMRDAALDLIAMGAGPLLNKMEGRRGGGGGLRPTSYP